MSKRTLSIFYILLLLTGCSSVAFYQEPSEKENSVLIGSKVKQQFPYDDQKTYIKSIDGLKVGSVWNDQASIGPFKVAPGPHEILVVMYQGLLSVEYLFNLDFEEGQTYVARSRSGNKDDYAEIWIENKADSELVTDVVRAKRERTGFVIIPL